MAADGVVTASSRSAPGSSPSSSSPSSSSAASSSPPRPGATPTTTRHAVALAVASGLLFGFAQPFVVPVVGDGPIDPTGLTGLLAFVSLVPLLVAVRGRRATSAFALAALAHAIGLFVAMHWWAVALATFGGWTPVVAVPAVFFGMWILAPLPAAAFPLAVVVARRAKLPYAVAFALAYGACELVRGHAPAGGVPWANLATALAPIEPLRQGAALVGSTGLVVVAALVNALLAAPFLGAPTRPPGARLVALASSRLALLASPRFAPAVAAAIVVALGAYGALRAAPTTTDTVRVAALQPSIAQDVLNRDDADAHVNAALRALQQDAIARGARLVVWPEAALRPMVPSDVVDLAAVGALAPGETAPAAAIVGALVSSTELVDGGLRIERRVRTSAVATSPGLRVVGRFDKARLVPFGEAVPWWAAWGVARVTTGAQVTPGDAYRPIAIDVDGRAIDVGATICWEGIFPEISRAYARAGARLLVNVANDAWYGTSSAALQHLWFSSLRAVETGRPVVRAGNVGVSAWFDARGTPRGATALFTRAAPVWDVPLATIDTPYLATGDALALAGLAIVVFAVVVELVQRLRQRLRVQ